MTTLKIGDHVHVPAASASLLGLSSHASGPIIYNLLVVKYIHQKTVVCVFDTPGGLVEGPPDAFVPGWYEYTEEDKEQRRQWLAARGF